ncbi:MAG: SWIM zinc finger domain-containing protein [Pirellulales bacterium]
MKLARRCFHSFDAGDSRRGEAYYDQRRVRMPVIRRNARQLTAHVRGSYGSVYKVRLDWSRAATTSVLEANCECPRFEDGFLCKHVWATILMVDVLEEPLIPGRSMIDVLPSDPLEDDGWDDARSGEGAIGAVARDERIVAAVPRTPNTRTYGWSKPLLEVCRDLQKGLDRGQQSMAAEHPRIWYVLDVEASRERGELVVLFFRQLVKRNGEFSRRWQKLRVGDQVVQSLANQVDGELLDALIQSDSPQGGGFGSCDFGYRPIHWHDSGRVPRWFDTVLLPKLCATGRFGWTDRRNGGPDDLHALVWDDGPAWRFELVVEPVDAERGSDTKGNGAASHDRETTRPDRAAGLVQNPAGWRVTGRLRRETERRQLSEPLILLRRGIVVFPESVARLDASDDFPWISMLRERKELLVPIEEQDKLVSLIYAMPRLPSLDLPPALRLREVREAPTCCIAFRSVEPTARRSDPIRADVTFDYRGHRVPLRNGPPAVIDQEQGCVQLRDIATERAATERLLALGMVLVPRVPYEEPHGDVMLPIEKFADVSSRLLEEGWQVQAEGRRLHSAGVVSLRVSSNVDWFDVEGEVDFGETSVDLPTLLRAIRRGSRYI